MRREETMGMPTVSQAKKDMEEYPVLRIPNVAVTENGSIDCDCNVTLLLEAAINDWKTVVSKTIDEEQSKQPDGRGPVAEVEYWKARNSLLSKLEEQVQGHAAKAILRTLKPMNVALIHEAEAQFLKLSRLAAEAAENASLLAILEKSFNTLVQGSISSIIHCIPQLLDSLSLVWTISKYYNRVERFLPLMEKISFQLVSKVRNSVDISCLLRYPSNKAVIYEAATMLDTWREVYKKVRKNMPGERLVQRRWDFEKCQLFDPTDYMAQVLRDLGELVETTSEFQRFLDPEISTMIGQSEDMHAVTLKVTSILNVLENIQFDIFDENQKEEWKFLVQRVGKMIVDTDHTIGSCIEKSFQTLKSSQAALDLVESLQIFHCVENHCRIERRFAQILDLYARELSDIEEVFLRSKLNPPKSKTLPQSASCIAWCMRLYQRAKRPILRFSCHEVILTCPLGNSVKQKYLGFARSIDAFKEMIYNEWNKGVASTVTEALSKAIIIESNGVWPSHGLPSVTRLLTSNFPHQISRVIREAKYFSNLGLSIPDEALSVVFQEDTFNGYLLHLNAMLQVRNKVLRCMTVVEHHVLKAYVSSVNEVFKRGLTDLNWTSLRIAPFVSSCSKSLEIMATVLVDVRKHLCEVEEAVIAIEGMTFFDENDFKSFAKLSVLDFVEIAKAKRTERVQSLVHKYRSIKPLLLKIEMIVEESDSGASPSLGKLYSYWEKRIYNALVTIVIRSLNSLLLMLRSVQNSECSCHLDVTVIPDICDAYAIPSLQDMEKYMYDLVRSIPESCRQVTRWMHGSCLEAPPQLVYYGVCEEAHQYSFYTDVSRNTFVKNLFIEVNEEILHHFSQIHGMLHRWLQYDVSYGLSDEEKKASVEKLTTEDPPYKLLEEKISTFQSLEFLMKQLLVNEEAESAEKSKSAHPIISKLIGIFHVDFSEFARLIANQARQWRLLYGSILHNIVKTRVDACTKRRQTFADAYSINLDSTAKLIDLLNAIGSVSDVENDTREALLDLKNRFATLFAYNIHVDKEETYIASIL